MPTNASNAPRPWTPAEDAAIVADYFAALDTIARGLPVNKSATRRALVPLLNGRPEGSIEFKRCNVSAILRAEGFQWWPGYRPEVGENYAKGLAEAVRAELVRRHVAKEGAA